MAAKRKSAKKAPQKRPGPPKAFDVDAALDAAMVVFWQKGFDGTSLTDLTEAMGINRPSLYATFGDKQSLFQQAVKRYQEQGVSVLFASAAQPTARAFVECLLRGQAELYTSSNHPPGCFFIQSTSGAEVPSLSARRETAKVRRLNEQVVRCHLQSRGELPAGLNPAQLAAYVTAVGNGLAIRAADGANRQELYRMVELALAFWAQPNADQPVLNGTI